MLFEKKEWFYTMCGCILVCIAVLYWFFTTEKDHSLFQKEHSVLIGTSYMTMNNPFYDIINQEIHAVVEQKGDILITRDPALQSEKQMEQIEEMMEQGIKVLVVTPVDYKAIMPIIREAKEKGIIVIVVDSEIEDETIADCTIVSNNFDAGKKMAEFMMEKKDKADIVLLKHSSTRSAQNRIAGFLAGIEGKQEYRIIDEIECKGQVEIAMPEMGKVIEEGKSFDTVFALNDPAAIGAMAALEEKGLLENKMVLGIDGAPEAKAMIKEDMMAATSAQFPSKIGRIAGKTIYDILENRDYESKILVPVAVVNEKNVDEFRTDGWQ